LTGHRRSLPKDISQKIPPKRSSLKIERGNRVSAQLRDIGLETSSGKQAGNFLPQAAAWGRLLNRSIAQNIPHFLFHAATVAPRAAPQSILHRVFDIANHKLGHEIASQNDIMISLLPSAVHRI
jgi:hypothetical protein